MNNISYIPVNVTYFKMCFSKAQGKKPKSFIRANNYQSKLEFLHKLK